MPFSLPDNIPPMIDLLRRSVRAVGKVQKPTGGPKLKVLDVGVGFGTWGFMIRQVIDGMQAMRIHERDWRVEIVGVECWKPYISRHHGLLYDQIHIGDIGTLASKVGTFDIAILGDVLEHFDAKSGQKLLRTLLRKCKVVLVSTPDGYLEQGEYAGNKHETHLSGWTERDFEPFGIQELKRVTNEREGFSLLMVALSSRDLVWPLIRLPPDEEPRAKGRASKKRARKA